MSAICITNDMHDIRPCTIKGEHQIVCNGWAYRWNTERGRLEATGKECKGCLPQEARKGLLCWNCWDSIRESLQGYDKLSDMLQGVDRAVQRDNGGVRGQSLGYIPIAAVPLMLEELRSYRRGAPADTDTWVLTVEGAKNAVRFNRAYKAAVRSHPVEETERNIQRTRCPECKQLNLVWHPANTTIDSEVVIRCSNTECGHSLTQDEYTEITVKKIHPDAPVILDAGAPANESGTFATPFTRTNPDHLALIETEVGA